MDDQVSAWAFAAARGSQGAAAAFVRATQPDVTRFLAHLTSPRDAEDLTQETYLRAFRSLPRFAGRASARTWLFSIARRVAADHLREAKRRPRTVTGGDWFEASDAARQPADAGRIDEQIVLHALIGSLPSDQREAFVATQVLGLSYEETATVCDCAIGTIRSRVARARAVLVAQVTARETTAQTAGA